MQGINFPELPPIPGYEPIEPLGVNLGTLYLARHSSSGTLVCLKVWDLRFAEHAQDLHGPAERLSHPNIIRTFEMGEFGNHFFCAVEYVKQTLADKLQGGPLPDSKVVRLASAIGSALQYARDQGVIPLSLSPNSIFLTDDNVPKLSDFGTSFRSNLPGPDQWAPEWVSEALYPLGSKEETSFIITETSQIFRMGVIMYEMLTATHPFRDETSLEETVRRVRHEMPKSPRKVNPRVGRNLEELCMKCLAKEPEARFVSFEDLLDHLQQSLPRK